MVVPDITKNDLPNNFYAFLPAAHLSCLSTFSFKSTAITHDRKAHRKQIHNRALIMATKRNAASTPNISDDLSAPSEVPVVVVREAPKGPRIPTILTFPLVVVMASSLLVLANTALVELTGPKLYPVSRNLREDWQIAVVTGWKVLELGIGWFAGFDGRFSCSKRCAQKHSHDCCLTVLENGALIDDFITQDSTC